MELPDWADDEPVTLYRHSSVVSTFAELSIANGWLRARHPAMERDQAAARRVENALRVVPGVIQATATGELCARFDTRAVAALQVIRIAEAEILAREAVHPVPSPEPVNFRFENITLGFAAVGEFVLPLVAPAASGLLALAALNTFGTAVSQLRERKIGLPLLYTCAVGTRLSSGQFLAASLLSWFFRYWEHAIDRTSLSRTGLCSTKNRPCQNGRVYSLLPATSSSSPGGRSPRGNGCELSPVTRSRSMRSYAPAQRWSTKPPDMEHRRPAESSLAITSSPAALYWRAV